MARARIGEAGREGDRAESDPAEEGALRQLNVPLQVNVAATLSGASLALVPAVEQASRAHEVGLPYANGLVRGANRWNYGRESGDWRYYFLDVPPGQPPGTQLVLRSDWQDGKPLDAEGNPRPRSDIDLLVYGPAADRWSDPNHPDNAETNLADPSFFGPHTTSLVGGSTNMNVRYGIWKFETATGDYEEWVTAGLTEGLHVIMAHNTLIAGDRFEVPFAVNVETARLEPEQVFATGPAAACYPVTFTPSFALDELVWEGYGMSPVEQLRRQPVRQDDPGNPLTASWRRVFSVTHGSRIALELDGVDGDDLDLFLYLDANGDGLPQAREQLASSTSPEPDERIVYHRPADGQYIVTVHGWKVPGDQSTFDLTMTVVQGRGVRAEGLQKGPIAAGQEVNFRLCHDALEGERGGQYVSQLRDQYVGELVFGPPQVPALFRLPVELRLAEPSE